MGGRPLLALSVAAFPESLPAGAVRSVFDAAAAKVREAGGLLAGGHTLRQDEPLYGLAVVGTVRPREVWTKAGARPGDVLFLTKPLGTGLLVHARKQGLIGDAGLAGAVGLMQTLNAAAADVARAFEPHAVTDVTGFGLLGHVYELATRSHVRVELDAGSLRGAPRRARARRRGGPDGGDPRNRAYVGRALDGRRRRRGSGRAGLRSADGGRPAARVPAGARGLLSRTRQAASRSRVGRVAAGDGEVRLAAAR